METISVPDYSAMKEALLTVFNRLAPTGRNQEAMVRTVHEMERLNEPYKDVLLTIMRLTIDGLTQGNWPEMG